MERQEHLSHKHQELKQLISRIQREPYVDDDDRHYLKELKKQKLRVKTELNGLYRFN